MTDPAYTYLIVAICLGLFVLAGAVALIRWVLRIDTIVAQQEEANKLLSRIAASLEAKKTSVFDP